MKSLGLIFIIALSTRVVAGPFSYECTIKGVYEEGNVGQLVDSKLIPYTNSTFRIDRKSGVVLGQLVSNSNYPIRQILDPGGPDQDYKVLWMSDQIFGTNGGRHVSYLTVNEYAKSESKPFVLVLGWNVLSGICH